MTHKKTFTIISLTLFGVICAAGFLLFAPAVHANPSFTVSPSTTSWGTSAFQIWQCDAGSTYAQITPSGALVALSGNGNSPLLYNNTLFRFDCGSPIWPFPLTVWKTVNVNGNGGQSCSSAGAACSPPSGNVCMGQPIWQCWSPSYPVFAVGTGYYPTLPPQAGDLGVVIASANPSNPTVYYEATTDQTWCHLNNSGSGGYSLSDTVSYGSPYAVPFSFSTGMSPGNYTCNIKFTNWSSGIDNSQMASNMPRTVPVSFTIYAPPTNPTSPNAVATSCSNVNLTWTASTAGGSPVTYTIFRGTSNTVLVSGISGTSYADATVAGSTSYSYWIQATANSQNSSKVAFSAVSTPACAVPVATTPHLWVSLAGANNWVKNITVIAGQSLDYKWDDGGTGTSWSSTYSANPATNWCSSMFPPSGLPPSAAWSANNANGTSLNNPAWSCQVGYTFTISYTSTNALGPHTDTITTTFVNSAQPDLTADTPTPATATLGTPQAFSSVITNAGNASTGAFNFFNFTRIANAPQGGGTITSNGSRGLSALGPGASSPLVSNAYNFPSAGTYSVQTCADNNTSMVGTVTESNESNNCSPWTDVTVSASAQPDLTAAAPTPTTVTAGDLQTFASTITNGGTASTGIGFTNLFQTSPVSDGSSGVIDYSVSGMSALSANGGNAVTSKALTFASAGTMYMRVCADKSSAGDAIGTIVESNDGNNCSPGWTTITVNPATPVPVVSISANPTSGTVGVVSPQLTWSATNGPTSCTASGDWPVNGAKPTAGNNVAQGVLNTVKTYSFTLTCSNATGASTPTTATVVVSAAAINGVCGSANGKAYPNGSSSYNPDVQCSSGTSNNSAFPTAGNTVLWQCIGSGAGHTDSPTCSASQNSAAPTTYILNVNKTIGGSVTSSPAGINCGITCSASYNNGTPVTLTANPDSAYWKFIGWTGDCSGTNTSTIVIVGAPSKTCTANFAPKPFQYQEF